MWRVWSFFGSGSGLRAGTGIEQSSPGAVKSARKLPRLFGNDHVEDRHLSAVSRTEQALKRFMTEIEHNLRFGSDDSDE